MSNTRTAASLFERLVSPSDRALEAFANVTLVDNGMEVPVSAVDQVLAALARVAVQGTATDTVVVQLPRGSHQVALLVGIASQLLCRRPPVSLSGPVVVIGVLADEGWRLLVLTA